MGIGPGRPAPRRADLSGSPRRRSSGSSSGRSAPATAATTCPPGRRRRCRGSTSGRSGTSRTWAFELGPAGHRPFHRSRSRALLYRRLVDAAWSALQATGHGHDTTLIGEVAPARADLRQRARPVRRDGAAALPARPVLRRLLLPPAARPGRRRTRLPGHGGRLGRVRRRAPGPVPRHRVRRPSLSAGAAARTSRTPDEPDYAELAEIPKLEHVLDTLQRVYGSHTRFPIYSTEFGYQTTPPDTEAGTVSPDDRRRLPELVRVPDAGATRACAPTTSTCCTIRRADLRQRARVRDGTPKPGFYAYRMPIFLPVTATARAIRSRSGAACARPTTPARDTRRPSGSRSSSAPAPAARFETVQTVPITDHYGYFDVARTVPGQRYGQARVVLSARASDLQPHGRDHAPDPRTHGPARPLGTALPARRRGARSRRHMG